MGDYSSRVAEIGTTLVRLWREQGRRNVRIENELASHQAQLFALGARVKELEARVESLTRGLEYAVGEIDAGAKPS